MKKFSILFFIFSVFFLGACSKITNKDISLNTTGNKIEKQNDSIDPVFAKYIKIINTYDINKCSQLSGELNERCKFSILTSLQKINSEKDCEQFDLYKKDCLRSYYMNNYLCDKFDKLPDKKLCLNNKYYSKAIETQNAYWCLYITDLKQRNYCNQDIEKIKKRKSSNSNSSVCSANNLFIKCSENNKDCKLKTLFSKFSIEPSLKKKKQYCKEIEKIDPTISKKCYNSYFYTKAIVSFDPNICSHIVNDKKLVQDCEQDSIYQKAIELTNLNDCKLLKDKKKMQSCEDEVNLRILTRDRLTDKNICEKMHDETLKKKCFDIVLKNL